MLMLRLRRIGKRVQPSYRLIVSEKHKDTQGKAIEILGHYAPKLNPATIILKNERIAYWLSKGAQCSGTVKNMLIDAGLLKDKKAKTIYITRKRAKKLAEKNNDKK